MKTPPRSDLISCAQVSLAVGWEVDTLKGRAEVPLAASESTKGEISSLAQCAALCSYLPPVTESPALPLPVRPDFLIRGGTEQEGPCHLHP